MAAARAETAGGQPPDLCDVAVVGGGIIGLAVARELIRRRPRASLCVFEREPTVGATVATSCAIDAVALTRRRVALRHERGETRAGYAVFCAGAWADRLAAAAGAGFDPRIVPFRGAYLRLHSGRRELVRALIYPVPDPSLPFLGAHLTRTIA